MKVARYLLADGTERCGVVDDGEIAEFDGLTFEDWIRDQPGGGTEHRGSRRLVTGVTLLPPIGRGAKVFCVGFNYATHSAEMDRELPKVPTLFLRHPASLVGHGTPVLRPSESAEFDWEGEVAIVIGSPARRVGAASAMDHVAGYTAFADNSIRDWQFHSTQATAGKNWEASGSCGPWLASSSDVDGDALALKVRLNGDEMQNDTTAHLHFACADLIAYISTFTTLQPGDVIATGTPSGIGYRREPPVFLTDGDVLEVEVEGVGVLSNPVIDDPAQTRSS